MRSRLLVSFAVLILLSLCAGAAHAASLKPGDTVYVYCGSGQGYVYLYDSPASFQILAKLQCGQKLTVVSLGTTWVVIRTADGKEGSLQYSDLGVLASPASEPPATPAPPAPPAPSAQPAPAQQSAPVNPQPKRPVVSAQSNPQPAAPQPSQQAAIASVNQLPAIATPSRQPAASAPAPHSTQDLQLASAAPAASRPPLSINVAALPPEPQPAFAAAAPPVTRSSAHSGWPSVSRLEVSGGYSYLNIDTNGTLASRLNVNGFASSVTVNVNRWLGAEGDLSGYFRTYAVDTTTAGLGIVNLNLHDYSFLAGPRFNFHPFFFHVLVGTDRLSGTALGATASQSGLSGAVGGGMEHRISRHIALTGSADYIFSRHDVLDFIVPGGPMYTQNNIRISGGVVFTSGSLVR